jgi:hypothetical protein
MNSRIARAAGVAFAFLVATSVARGLTNHNHSLSRITGLALVALSLVVLTRGAFVVADRVRVRLGNPEPLTAATLERLAVWALLVSLAAGLASAATDNHPGRLAAVRALLAVFSVTCAACGAGAFSRRVRRGPVGDGFSIHALVQAAAVAVFVGVLGFIAGEMTTGDTGLRNAEVQLIRLSIFAFASAAAAAVVLGIFRVRRDNLSVRTSHTATIAQEKPTDGSPVVRALILTLLAVWFGVILQGTIR